MQSLGRHILSEFFNCNRQVLNDVATVEKTMVRAAVEAGATVISSSFHHFSPWGVSGVVVIAESHLAIHTWPEYAFASVDFFTCGDAVDPWQAAEVLKQGLQAAHDTSLEMLRGQVNRLPEPVAMPGLQALSERRNRQAPRREAWFTERTEGLAISVRHEADLLHRQQGEFQRIEVFQTETFGKMLVLDGVIALTEEDEFAYHEMMVHIPLNVHPKPQKVLVLGGGDGGICREVARYPDVQQITVVEQDRQITATSQRFFPEIASSLQDLRVSLFFEDAGQFLSGQEAGGYDVVVVDLPDPLAPEKFAESPELPEAIHKILKDNGMMVVQTGSPKIHASRLRHSYSALRKVFGQQRVFPYLAWMPAYPAGTWSFACCHKNDLKPQSSVVEARQRQLLQRHQLNYYSAAIHQACFVLPGFVERLM